MFDRLIRVIGEKDFSKIQATKIAIIGIGGVGGYALESLIRSGIKYITLVEFDTIEETNLNRQIFANQKNIGNSKLEEAILRIKEINPSVDIQKIEEKLTTSQLTKLKDNDYIIDACDDTTLKVALIEYAYQNNIKLITCLGTGNRTHPEKLTITTLDKTFNDPLAKKIRNQITEKSYLKTPVVFSEELPIKTEKLGTFCSVPMSAGSLLASYVMNDIIKKILE